jgi:hypothetical protein
MLKFSEVPNILIAGTLVTFTPNKQRGLPPDSVEMTVEGYETEIMILLSKLRWSWTGWALVNDIFRLRNDRSMLIIPWNELPYIDPATHNWEGFNATAGAVTFPKLQNGPVDMGQVKKAAYDQGRNTLVRYNPGMWVPEAVAAVGFIPKAADFKQAPGVEKDEILLHEMVHGLRQMRGTTDFHKPADFPHYDTVEEFIAIVVSNVYRSENNRPGLRQDHWGFSKLPAEQEDPKKFLDVAGASGESNRSRMEQFKKDNPQFFDDLKRAPAAFNPFKYI